MSGLYYSLIGILGLIIQLILYQKYFQDQEVRVGVAEFKRFLAAIFVYFCFDSLWGVADMMHNTSLLYVSTVVWNISLGITVYFCCRYIIAFLNLRNTFGRLLDITGAWFCIVGLILLVINHFYGNLFWYDSDGTYHTEIVRYAPISILVMLYSSLSFVAFNRYRKSSGSERAKNKIIFFFGIIMTMALMTQVFTPLLPIYSIGLILSIIIIRLYIFEDGQRALQEEIIKARDAAETANAAKTAFLFNMSHDIRTPMNAIVGFRNLLEKYQDDPERRLSYLNKIREASSMLLSIINNVLEIARIEKATIALEEKPTNVKGFSDSLFSIFDDMMEQKKIDFFYENRVATETVYCDPTKLHAIFVNVISNAYKYTNEGGNISMIVEELPTIHEGSTPIRTTITDNGIGMSEEFLPHLFEEFSRERSESATKIEGTGLGMPIVKSYIDLMGGTIDVKSKKGEGTTFIITIEHRKCDKTAENICLDDHKDLSTIVGKRILLAEDNALNAEIAIEILKEAGMEAELAVDGAQAVEMLSNASDDYYDLILMDIQMPKMNGYEAASTIRAMSGTKARIPIIAMTANAFEEDRKQALNAGMNDHTLKPVDINDLLNKISSLLQ